VAEIGPVAQSDRASDFGPEGSGGESLRGSPFRGNNGKGVVQSRRVGCPLFPTSQIHAQPNGMVGETVGFAIALAANVSD